MGWERPRSRGSKCGCNFVGIIRRIQAHDQVGDAVALQQPLRLGQRNAQIAVVKILETGVDDTHDLHVDAVQGAVGGDGQNGEAVAQLHVHRSGDAASDESLGIAAGALVEIAARGQRRREAHPALGIGIDGAAHEHRRFDAVGEHSVELDAGRDAAHVIEGCTEAAALRQSSMPVSSTCTSSRRKCSAVKIWMWPRPLRMVLSRSPMNMNAKKPPTISRPATPQPTISRVITVRRRLRKTLRNARSRNLPIAASIGGAV